MVTENLRQRCSLLDRTRLLLASMCASSVTEPSEFCLLFDTLLHTVALRLGSNSIACRPPSVPSHCWFMLGDKGLRFLTLWDHSMKSIDVIIPCYDMAAFSDSVQKVF